MANQISPLASIAASVQLGENIKVGPFSVIGENVVIGNNCDIHSHVSILPGTTIGSGNRFFENTVIGAEPQSFRYKEGDSRLVIGNGNTIRENVVIAGSLNADHATTIGDENFIMDGVHICHDVQIDNHCVVGIHSQISGDCLIEDNVILSSAVILQHKVRVGRYTLVQNGCRTRKDIPPYIILGGNPATYHGVNAEILSQYAGVSEKILRHISNTYRLIYMGNFSLEDALIRIGQQIPQSEEIDNIVNFIKASEQGIVRRMKEEQ